MDFLGSGAFYSNFFITLGPGPGVHSMMTGEKDKPEKKKKAYPLLRRGDVLVILLLAVLAGAILLVTHLTARPGTRAEITTPEGVLTLSLEEDQIREITGRDGIRVVIRIEDGRACFEESGCPDQICVHSGWLSSAGQSAACVPAGVALRIIGGEDDGLDAVTA